LDWSDSLLGHISGPFGLKAEHIIPCTETLPMASGIKVFVAVVKLFNLAKVEGNSNVDFLELTQVASGLLGKNLGERGLDLVGFWLDIIKPIVLH
jgi:hypothetical protein